MIKALRITDYKGIESVALPELGRINVICGKNNSGKSSILEGISTEGKRSQGIEVDDDLIQEIKELFWNQAKGYSNPNPRFSRDWFDKFISKYVQDKPIWFEEEKGEFTKAAQESLREDAQIGNYTASIFQYEILFDRAFKRVLLGANDLILISPKRTCRSISKIELDKELSGDGDGVVNKLFFLKNQDLDSGSFKIYQRILSIFKSITGCSFNLIPTEKNEIELKFLVNSNWENATNCGMGLKDILILLTIIYSTTARIYLVEEPENHLHADFQIKFLNNLRDINGKQFIISTHSNEVLNHNAVDQLYYSWFNEKVNVSNKTSISKIIDSLGHSIIENISSDLIILVEGPTDIPVFKKILELYNVSHDANIKFWPLGGDVMGSIDLSIFSGLGKVLAIVDTDPGSTTVRNRFKRNCKEHSITIYTLERYSIENYFPINIIRKTFPNQIPKSITELDSMRSVDEQLGFKEKKKTIKGKNMIMANGLLFEHVEQTDLKQLANVVLKLIQNET